MESKTSREFREIRNIQADLRRRLDASEERLDRLDEMLRKESDAGASGEPVVSEENAFPDFEGKGGFIHETPPPLPQVEYGETRQPNPLVPELAPELHTEEDASVGVQLEREVPPRHKRATGPGGDSFELHFGRVWLVRIGVVILLTGLVFLGNHAYHEFIGKLGAPGRLALIYLAAIFLGGLGAWLSRRAGSTTQQLRQYGRVLLGAGLATAYFATFAAHFIEPLRVIDQPLVAGVLLTGFAAAVLWFADRIQSQAMASVMIALAFYSSAINRMEGFSLYSNVLLCGMALVLLLRRGWMPLNFLALAGSYGALAFWRMQQTGGLFDFSEVSGGIVVAGLVFPLIYWLLFTAAALLQPGVATLARTTLLTLNNAGFFALAGTAAHGLWPHYFGWIVSFYGAVLLLIAVCVARSGRYSQGFEAAWLVQGLLLVPLGCVLSFTGFHRSIAMALQSGLLVSLSHLRHGRILLVFSLLSAGIASAAALVEIAFGIGNVGSRFLVAGLLGGIGWLCQHKRTAREVRGNVAHPVAMIHVFLGLLLAVTQILVWQESPADLYWLAALAIGLLVTGWFARTLEFWLAGQATVVVVNLIWFLRPGLHGEAAPFLVLAALTTAVIFCHRRGGSPGVQNLPRQAAHATLLAGMLFVWTFSVVPGDMLYSAWALIGLVWLAAGGLCRISPLTLGSVVFTAAGAAGLIGAVFREMSWATALPGVLLILANSPLIHALRRRWPEGFAPLCVLVQRVLHGYGVVMALLGIFVYLPLEFRFLALVGSAFALFLFTLATRKPAPVLYALPFALIGAILFMVLIFTDSVSVWREGLGCLLFLVAQQLGKHRCGETAILSSAWQGMLMLFGLLGLWYVCGSFLSGTGLPLTVAWSLFALAVLAAGFPLRERMYRIVGLIVLGLTIGRAFFFDVWELDTMYRIVSFLVLGVVLLLLGFVYNRFSEHIRRWI